MKVWLDESASAPTANPFFETHDWEHAPNFTRPLHVTAGSSIRTQCDYFNGDTTEVFQGPNAATSEMCVFAGLYYPKIEGEFEQCAGISVAGNGTQPCPNQLTCIQQCPSAMRPSTRTGASTWARAGKSAWPPAVLAQRTRSCPSRLRRPKLHAECAAGDCTSCVVESAAGRSAPATPTPAPRDASPAGGGGDVPWRRPERGASGPDTTRPRPQSRRVECDRWRGPSRAGRRLSRRREESRRWP